MKSLIQPLLARLRATAVPAGRPKLIDTKAVIERSLRQAGLMPPAADAPAAANDASVIEGEFRVVDDAQADTARTASRPRSAPAQPGKSMSSGEFSANGASRHYKLFVPMGFEGQRLPLIVMLHGCTQDPEDFARGTRMNVLAQESGAIVLYPQQAPRSNSSRCWNWFQPGDQLRGAGEPALLAEMTREVMRSYPVDPDRVFVAGLSAGGAMAAILGREYPDLYAAIGVHSGLAPGAARDIPSAFAAMKSAPAANHELPKSPVIVFHGDRDATVHPQNGESVIGTSGARSSTQGNAGRAFTRTLIRNTDGSVRAEHWLVDGAGHAWSGGSSEGSYADSLGPDASREMLRFFLEHPRA